MVQKLNLIKIAWENFVAKREIEIKKRKMILIYLRICVLLKLHFKRHGKKGIKDTLKHRIRHTLTFATLC